MNLNKIGMTISIIVAVGGIIGAFYTWEKDIPKAADLSAVQQQLQIQGEIINKNHAAQMKLWADFSDNQQIQFLDKRIWEIEQRYKGKVIPVWDGEELRRMKLELSELRRK